MNRNPDHRRFLSRQLTAFEKYRFRTNAILTLAWHQPSRVNGRPLDIGPRAFTVLLFLVERAFMAPGDYFQTHAIVSTIEKKNRQLGQLNLSWDRPTPGNVHTAVCDLRHALTSKKLSEFLIESARPRLRGYRLSTPPMNIITDPCGEKNLELLSMPPSP